MTDNTACSHCGLIAIPPHTDLGQCVSALRRVADHMRPLMPPEMAKYVAVSDELVAEMTDGPSRPVTVAIARDEGGRLDLWFTTHHCDRRDASQLADLRVLAVEVLRQYDEGDLQSMAEPMSEPKIIADIRDALNP